MSNDTTHTPTWADCAAGVRSYVNLGDAMARTYADVIDTDTVAIFQKYTWDETKIAHEHRIRLIRRSTAWAFACAVALGVVSLFIGHDQQRHINVAGVLILATLCWIVGARHIEASYRASPQGSVATPADMACWLLHLDTDPATGEQTPPALFDATAATYLDRGRTALAGDEQAQADMVRLGIPLGCSPLVRDVADMGFRNPRLVTVQQVRAWNTAQADTSTSPLSTFPIHATKTDHARDLLRRGRLRTPRTSVADLLRRGQVRHG